MFVPAKKTAHFQPPFYVVKAEGSPQKNSQQTLGASDSTELHDCPKRQEA
jgi:hypothetical protein